MKEKARQFLLLGLFPIALAFLVNLITEGKEKGFIKLLGVVGLVLLSVAAYYKAEDSGYHGPSVFIIPVFLAGMAWKVISMRLVETIGAILVINGSWILWIFAFAKIVEKTDKRSRIASVSVFLIVSFCIYFYVEQILRRLPEPPE